jgi:hypothetical protein
MERFRFQAGSLVAITLVLGALFQISPVGEPREPATVALLAVVGAIVALVALTSVALRVPAAVFAGLTILAYVVLRANPLMGVSDWSGWVPAIAMIELSLCAGAVFAARQFSLQLAEFEEAVANITMGDLARVKSLDDAADDIAVEMSRARRHERPLTVTVLSAEPSSVSGALHRIVQDVQSAMMQRYIMSGLARLAAQVTRRGDIVVQDFGSNRVIVLSPEAAPDQIEHLTGRLQAIAAERLGLPLRLGSAGFPDHALTFDDLVLHASVKAGQIPDGDMMLTDEIAMRRRRQAWVAALEMPGRPASTDAGLPESGVARSSAAGVD